MAWKAPGLDQYWAFWGRLFHGDFGVSFFQFPTPVNQLIATALPWTLGLLLTTTPSQPGSSGISLGGFAGYYSTQGVGRGHLDAIAMVIRPLPYYIFAFALLLLFAYVCPLVPAHRRGVIGSLAAFHLGLYQGCPLAFVPACPLDLFILGRAVRFQTMKLIVQNVNAESFVQYAKLGGVTEEPHCSASTSFATPCCRKSPGWRFRSGKSSAAR